VATFLCGLATVSLAAGKKETTTIVGHVSKVGKDFIIGTEDEDYIVKGKDLTDYLNSWVEATGYVSSTPKGLVIDVISVEDGTE
jgi:hypothetical protein